MIDRLTVDKIIDAANIVDVVGEFVNLRTAGVNDKGLCPFHDDKTPSFMVSPAKNICHCFACGKGGTPVSFLMEHEQITYPEALRWLANKYNIEIEERELTDDERREQGERESMFIVNEWAKDYFQDILNNDIDGQAIGKQYFRSRGIRDDIMSKFALGYSPARRDAMATAAIAKGYKPEFLLKTGLCYERNQVDKLTNKQVDKLSDAEKLIGKVKWVACNDQFFSSVLIAEDYFTNVEVESNISEPVNYLKDCKTQLSFNYDASGAQPTNLKYYFGTAFDCISAKRKIFLAEHKH